MTSNPPHAPFPAGIRAVLMIAALALPALVSAGSAALTRGPFLQLATHEQVLLRWRTDLPAGSRVWCGPDPGSLVVCAEEPDLKTEHAVALTGLVADTLYYYGIGTVVDASPTVGGDAQHWFVTAPLPGTSSPTRVWVLGDSGTANAAVLAVRDAYLSLTGALHTDLMLMLGDNAYPTGTDAEYQQALFDVFGDSLRRTPVWPAIGNHDIYDAASQSWPYFDIFDLPDQGQAGGVISGTENYYSFDHANVHFVVLDSQISARTPGSAMLTWLDADLAATDQDWIVAYWHHPPYSKGSHDSDNPGGFNEIRLQQMRENVVPVLEDYGVDLVLAGHSHSYERSYLIDGHHGDSTTFVESMKLDAGDGDEAGDGAYEKLPRGATPYSGGGDGAVYAVSGSAGRLTIGTAASLGGIGPDHPAMVTTLFRLGSMVLEIDAGRLDATFLDDTGVVRDRFTILKDCPAGDLDEDGICDDRDNCPGQGNPPQDDGDQDGTGDVCDPCPLDPDDDADGDGHCAEDDNCPNAPNANQQDQDGDGQGDVCDPCPTDELNDADGDGLCADADPCPYDPQNNADGDNRCGDVDNCPTVPNNNQHDSDEDGVGDVCDVCPGDPLNDADGDALCGLVDNCPFDHNPSQTDGDTDGIGDPCDPCPVDAANDADSDGVCEEADNCPVDPNPGQEDIDLDGLGDDCDSCPGDPQNNADGDNYCGDVDNCPDDFNPNQKDDDEDGQGNACDACPDDPQNDLDADGICGDVDNCPAFANPDQLDDDEDGIGDACQVDGDGDGVPDVADNCPVDPNPPQDDDDSDGVGDACDNCPQVANPDQGPAPFPETILPDGTTRFVWQSPHDIEFVRGDLADVASYLVDVWGSQPAAAALTDTLEPPWGAIYYYLVKLDGFCGSWQSAIAVEPQRDALLP
ncbi:MAG: hypothetical protein GY716_03150 [bacterium]|nr:hypothetical protein [bacterium]